MIQNIKHKIKFFLILCCINLSIFAQKDYIAEIGFNAGTAFYLGDANAIPFKNLDFNYGIVSRYKIDKRFAAKMEFGRAGIHGEKEGIAFSNRLNLLEFCGEYNFFNLENNEYSRFSKTFSPYIFAGLGAMSYAYETNRSAFGISLPFGFGLKVMLGKRLNLNFQFANRLLSKDNLEGVEAFNNNNRLNGSNFFNNDLISTITIGLTYDFWKRPCDCNIADDSRVKLRKKKR